MAKKKVSRKNQKRTPKKLTFKEQQKKFLAKKEIYRQKVAPRQRDLENGLLKLTLAKTLALYIIRNSDVPLNQLVTDLFEIEAQAGAFVGKMHEMMGQSRANPKLKGALANALPFITMGNLELMSGHKSRKAPKANLTKKI